MTFVEKHRFESVRTERELMKIAWEGELFGVGLFETLAERFPRHADQLTACATMEWFNVHACEPLGHAAGVHVPLAKAERLGREGAAFARSIHTFHGIARLAIEETREVDPLFKKISKNAETPEVKTLGDDLLEHEDALRDWFKSELDGNSGQAAFPSVNGRG